MKNDQKTGTQAAEEMAELRQRAEEMAGEHAEDVHALSAEDARRLIHELRVHQIELEMQNEELRRAHRELSASRDRYADLYDFAPVGYVTVGEKGLIEAANLTAAMMLGVDRRTLVARPLSRFIARSHQDTFYLHRRRASEGDGPQQCEIRMVREDGAPFDASLESVAIRGSEDGDTQLRVVMIDITRRKQAEDALRQAGMQRALLDISTAVQAMIRPSDLERVMQVCLAAVQQAGIDAQTVAVHRLVDEAEGAFETVRVGAQGTISVARRAGRKQLIECWRSGRIVLRGDIKTETPEEMSRFRVRFGGVPIRSFLDCPFSRGVLSVHSIHPNEFSRANAEVLGQVGEIFAVGISRMEDLERVEGAHEALAENEARFKELVELLPQAVFEMDERGDFTFINRQGLGMFGYTQADLDRGLGVLNLFVSEEHERIREKIRQRLRGETATGNEYAARKKDGSAFPVLVYSSPIFRKSRSVGIRGIAIDITERKQAEETLRESQLVYQEQLRSLVSELVLTEERERQRLAADLHDRIGQALAVSTMKLGVLQASAPSAGFAGSLGEIGDLIGQTVKDIRSLTFELSPPVLYEKDFEAAVEWLAGQIREQHGIRIEVDDDGQPKPLDDDVRVLLFRAVRELLMNVVRHAQTDHAEVSVRKQDDDIYIVVEDEGIGFDSSQTVPQVDRSGGFGLFSVRERLDFLGGTFRVESEPGGGTRAVLVAPLNRSAKAHREKGYEHPDSAGRRP